MDKNKLLQEMKDSIGTQNPIDFFSKFVNVFELLFDKIEKLESNLKNIKINTALSIQWEPKIAADMLVKQIDILRNDKVTYAEEISALKLAYAEGKVVQSYDTFCQFWVDTLGWHPFLDY